VQTLDILMVRMTGIEPVRFIQPQDFKSVEALMLCELISFFKVK